jgi:hypothetical protein
MFGKHNCGDSKLGCVECSAQICPKCMIVCPVGNRCKPCANKTESHVLKVTPLILAKTAASTVVIGYLFGWVIGAVPIFGFFSWIALYVGGMVLGNVVQRLIGFKMAPKFLR